MISIAKEIEETPDLVLTAPHNTRTAGWTKYRRAQTDCALEAG